MIEVDSNSLFFQNRILDVGLPAVTYPHIGSGLGGTTIFWHNGLIEISKSIFDKKWPFSKSELMPYYRKAFFTLTGRPYMAIFEKCKLLLKKYQNYGFKSEQFGEFLYYPKKRINAWSHFNLEDRVELLNGRVEGVVADSNNNIEYLLLSNKEKVYGDIFIFCAGGIGTPLLLRKIKNNNNIIPKFAGCFYEDHPCALVGNIVLRKPLYKLWNFPCYDGNLRLPIVIEQDGLQISFQLRPSSQFKVINPSNRVKNILNELRNNPLNIKTYFRLLLHFDDIMEILSFKFNINLPTRHYSLLMVSEQKTSVDCSIWNESDSSSIFRKWSVSDESIIIYHKAIKRLKALLLHKCDSIIISNDWENNLYSSSHHSGTARISNNPEKGVCDKNCKVNKLSNLYVCDGSIIPSSGVANTGLTIAALALRLSDHLSIKYRADD
jgi:hypothetical protein